MFTELLDKSGEGDKQTGRTTGKPKSGLLGIEIIACVEWIGLSFFL